RELYNWSKTNHENVLKLTGIAMFREQLAMISPWMGNGTLGAYIYKNPGVDRWALCLQVAEGLAYMHRIKMVHGDLKATNVFVSDEGVVKLGDFGHSILEHHSLSFSATTNFGGGTARWMVSPTKMIS
ncbi:kinase-like protein, partial [Ceratobasidium sp. AG-I]